MKKSLVMRLRAAVFTLACALISNSASANNNAPRIVSTSICGDAYLAALQPEGVAALSWQSRDALSRLSEDWRQLPQVWDDAEILAAHRPSIIIFGSGEGYKSSPFFMNSKTVTLTWGEDFETVFKNLDDISAVTGSNADLRSAIKKRLEALSEKGAMRSVKPKVLYLSRSGGSAGAGTLVDTAINAAGGENVIKASGWVSPDMEYMMGLSPDLIITSFFDQGYTSVNDRALRHKELRRMLSQVPRLSIPGSVWPCAGPDLIIAAEMIAQKLDELP